MFSLLRERNPSASLPIHRSDEFRAAIPWPVARQQSPPPLRRPPAMLTPPICQCQEPAGRSDLRKAGWEGQNKLCLGPVPMAGFGVTTEVSGLRKGCKLLKGQEIRVLHSH